MSMRLTVNLASPCLFSFLVTAVYLLTCRLYINWAHSIMAVLIIITVQQNWCLPFEHDCLHLLALALFFSLCPGEYSECPILFDRPYLGVSSMYFVILLPGIDVVFWPHGSPFGFQWSSAIRQHYVCVA